MKKYQYVISFLFFPLFFACNKTTTSSVDDTNSFDSIPVVEPVKPLLMKPQGLRTVKLIREIYGQKKMEDFHRVYIF